MAARSFDFKRNAVIIDQSAGDDRAPLPPATFVALIQNLDVVEDNSITTNLAAPGRTLAVSYDGSAIVRNQHYRGPFVG